MVLSPCVHSRGDRSADQGELPAVPPWHVPGHAWPGRRSAPPWGKGGGRRCVAPSAPWRHGGQDCRLLQRRDWTMRGVRASYCVRPCWSRQRSSSSVGAAASLRWATRSAVKGVQIPSTEPHGGGPLRGSSKRASCSARSCSYTTCRASRSAAPSRSVRALSLMRRRPFEGASEKAPVRASVEGVRPFQRRESAI
eukprot:6443048-Alexandrium_andersonii.AAC.1